jgi:hypothetical protein
LLVVALVAGSGSDAGVADRHGHGSERELAGSSPPRGELSITGELDERVAWPIMDASEAEVRRCRDRFAPSRSGHGTVRFLVGQDGCVGTVQLFRSLLSPSLAVPKFEECLVTGIRALRFPAREGIAWVTYSYVLP